MTTNDKLVQEGAPPRVPEIDLSPERLAFYQAVATQSKEGILRFSEQPQIDYLVLEKDGNPFDRQYRRVAVLAENNSTSIEVLVDASGKKYLRKSKRDEGEIARYHERGHDFLRTAEHRAFPKAHAFFSGTVDGQMVSTSLRDYVPGKNLEQIVKDGGALEPRKALRYTLQILDGLGYAHERGILLRDIKPSQFIREDETDTIRIIDVDTIGSVQSAGTSGTMTLAVHSQKWQHPEAQTPMAGVHTELFAIGTMLYYLLTSAEPDFERNGKRQYTLTGQKWSVLENKFRNVAGGRELIRTVKGMVEPTTAMMFASAGEVGIDLQRIDHILERGYSLGDYHFRLKGRDTMRKARDALGGLGKKLPLYAMGGVLIGVGGGLATGTILAEQERREQATPAVYERMTENDSEPHIIQSVQHLFNLINDIHRFSIETREANEERPNDIAQQKTLAQFREQASETRSLFAKAREDLMAQYGSTIATLKQAITTYHADSSESKRELTEIMTALRSSPKLEITANRRVFDDETMMKDALGREVIDRTRFMEIRDELLSTVEESYRVLQTKDSGSPADIFSEAQKYLQTYDSLMKRLHTTQDQLAIIHDVTTGLNGKITSGEELTAEDITRLYESSLSTYHSFLPEARITADTVSYTSAKPLLAGLAVLLLGVVSGGAVQAIQRRR